MRGRPAPGIVRLHGATKDLTIRLLGPYQHSRGPYVAFEAHQGLLYQVESSPTLEPGDWSTELELEGNNTYQFLPVQTGAGDHRFLRLRASAR